VFERSDMHCCIEVGCIDVGGLRKPLHAVVPWAGVMTPARRPAPL
jgi:hypothetical protein